MTVAVIVLVTAALGTYLLISSHAAVPSSSSEVENAALTSPAAVISDSAASGGKAVRFGGATGTVYGQQPGPPELFDATDGSTDYLHTPIPANPVLDPNSSTIVGDANLASNIPHGPVDNQWNVPIYITHNSDPVYHPSLSHASDWGCSVGGGGIHIPNYATRELPGGSGGDGWVETVNVDDGTVGAIWQADKSSGTWNGSCGGVSPLHSNGFKFTQGVGAGGGEQIGVGIILNSELLAGSINHALYMTSTDSCSTYREPATKSDGHATGSSCWPMGARIQLDPSVNCDGLSGASSVEKMVCHTMQTYGSYILDSGGSGPMSGISIIGDDMTDPSRQPWTTPGNGLRGSPGCTPVSATCGIWSHVGLSGSPSDFSHIPWTKVRILAHWNGT